MIKKSILENIVYILYIFLMGAFLGGVLEILYFGIVFKEIRIGGFLFGPWRPIYGYGSLLLYLISKKIDKNIFKMFLYSTVLCTIFEYLSSFFLELLFHKTWWDYSNNFLNINGRVCLFNSLCWGVLGVLFLYYISPLLKKIYSNFSFKKMAVYIGSLFFIYEMDGILSWIRNLK